MGLISQKTAEKIWSCYREINTAKTLLKDMHELRMKYPNDPHAQSLKDCFGVSRSLQLGVPSGENSHRLFNVKPQLAESVIRAHIAAQESELVEANEQAKIELLEIK